MRAQASQGKLLGFSHATVYYLPRPLYDSHFAMMRQIGEFDLEYYLTESEVATALERRRAGSRAAARFYAHSEERHQGIYRRRTLGETSRISCLASAISAPSSSGSTEISCRGSYRSRWKQSYASERWRKHTPAIASSTSQHLLGSRAPLSTSHAAQKPRLALVDIGPPIRPIPALTVDRPTPPYLHAEIQLS